jgi:hypothetical protein
MIQHLFRLPSLVALFLFVALGAGGRGAMAGSSCVGAFVGTPSIVANTDGALVGAAVCVAGTDVIVGAPGAGVATTFVYRRGDLGAYALVGQLARPNTLLSSSGFGSEIATDNAVAVVGAPFHNSNQGAVVLYTRSTAGIWTALQTIVSPVGLPNGCFGMSVALGDGFLAVGAPGAINSAGYARGVVFLYGRDSAGTYSLLRQFDPLEATATDHKYFGWSVALVNSHLLITAPWEILSSDGGREGSLYAYKRDGAGAWNGTAHIKSPGGTGTFGTDLAAGSQNSAGAGTSIFVREQRPGSTDAVWIYEAVDGIPRLRERQPPLTPYIPATATQAFGGLPATDVVLTNTMAIHEGSALVGNPTGNPTGNPIRATVDQYVLLPAGWAYLSTISGTGGSLTRFGQGVALGHDQFAIGAPWYSYALNVTPGYVKIGWHVQPDCDADGTPDACELAMWGTDVGQYDVNLDGIPDACETVAAPTSLNATQGTIVGGVGLAWPAVTRAASYKISVVADGVETQLGTSFTPQYVDTSPAPGVLLTYRVYPVSAAGTISVSCATATGWRGLASPVLTATDGTSTTGVTLTWNGVLGATTYEIYRGTSSTVPIATVSPLTYVDTGATPGVSYAYRVRAKCTLGVGGFSEPNVGWIAANASPLTLAATDGISSSNVTLTWTVPTGGTSAYTILRGEGSKPPKVIGTVGTGVLTYVDAAVPKAGKAYTYVVRISTATSGGRQDVGWKATIGPSAVVATDGTLQTGVQLTWALAPKASKASSYVVYRAATGGSPVPIASLGKKAITHLDTTAIPGSSYTYSVRAYGSLGLSMPGSDTGWRPLAAPTNFDASDNKPDRIALTWNASTGATNYLVTRTASGTSVEFNAGVSNYNDTSAVAGIIYTYTVRAVCTLGLSPSSASDTGTRVSSFSTLLAGGGAAKGGSVDSSGRVSTGSDTPDEMEESADDETSADHTWLIDGVKIENGPFVMNHHDAMVVKLRDPASVDDASMLVLFGEGFLDGTLRVAFDEYQPTIGDEWTVILSGGLVGDFRRVLLPALPEGMSMETERVGTIYQVRVIATPE